MRRGPKPAKPKVEAKRSVARKSPKNDGARVRDLEKRLAESLEREKATGRALTEALEQQTATAGVLSIISASPSDLQAVLDAVVKSAARFCSTDNATIFQVDGDTLCVVAHHGPIPVDVGRRFPCGPGTVGGRTVLERRAFHVTDLQAEAAEFPEGSANAKRFGHRTTLSVPLLREGTAIGAIQLRRPEADRFTDRQVALLQIFADQAVIAIENVRLFKETKEALDRQTVTAEILRVIASSPTELQPVLDAIATNATLVCDAYDAVVFLREGDLLRPAAHHGPITITLQHTTLSGGSITETAILDRQPVHVHDVLASEPRAFPLTAKAARAGGFRTVLAVPLLREHEAIGALAIRRREVQPFTPQQIELLKTFADQAVIAIENVRLFTELQEKNQALTQAHAQVSEALEQQTATSEILRVISSSPTDIQPVLDAVASSAARLCDSLDGSIFRVDGDVARLMAHKGPISEVDKGPITAVGYLTPTDVPIVRGTVIGRAIIERRAIQVADLQAENQDFPEGSARARRIGWRTQLSVPLLREGGAIGVIALRRIEARPFSDSQIALLQTFADQAVIAIENVRLFKETKEALERQTATSEILRVISSSPTDVQPVFDAIVTSATRLLRGYSGSLYRLAGDQIELIALTSTDAIGDAALKAAYPRSVDSDDLNAQAIRRRVPLNFAEAQTDPRLPEITHAYARARGFQSVGVVPMLRHEEAIGAIGVGRRDPGGFTDAEIALLKTFADQAVIAIENVRLFTELQEKNRALTEAHAKVSESLEQQTATSKILQAISQSPTDVQPVFDAIAQSAVRLCDAVFGAVFRYDGALVHLAAHHIFSEQQLAAVALQYPMTPTPTHISGRAILTGATAQIPDIALDAQYGSPLAMQWGYRSLLAVPILRAGAAIGVIVIYRKERGLFADQHIHLLQTFADQAVIAIENVRLFTELQASNRELTSALDTQTATSDILRVISRSQTDVQPVFDAILGSAVRLLGAYSGSLTRSAGDQIELAALTSTDEAGDAAVRALYPRSLHSEGTHTQAIHDRAPLNITDAHTDPRVSEAGRASARARGFRSQAVVPLLHHDEAVGTISVTRREQGGFTDDEIALLKTFADQAVIAIENVRLFKELEVRTQELTRSVGELRALSEVGQAISSTLDLQAVLTTMVAHATHLSGTDAGVVYEYDQAREIFLPRATAHLEAEIVETMLATPVRKGEGASGRLAEVLQPIQVPDILAAPAESRVRGALVRAGYRALLAVPLVREGHLIGGLTVIRRATGAFPPETIELLQTFATQSSLAIQNARLFREIEDKSRQLEVASQHKSEFLANMSHELRTPLNAIIGFSEVLAEKMFGELNEKQEEYSKDIHASGQHLLSLINDILDLSKIEAGRMELELTDFHLPTALDSALTLIRERAGRRGIALQMNVDGRLGQLRGDERKVRQVVLNLLSNAIKFTPEGGRIEVAATPKDGLVEVSVSDTGVGIAPEDQEAVFEEFRQVGTADKKVEGTGLGLTLCRKFVELHGGRIWVKSEIGVGSTFTFTLPVRRGE